MSKRRFRIAAKGKPDLPGMMLATVEALRALGGSASNQELDEKVIEVEGVTETEQTYTMPDGNRTRVHYYLAWARTYLKGGDVLVNSSRGVWALTDKSETITSLSDTRKIQQRVAAEARDAHLRRKAHRPPEPNVVDATEDNGQEATEDSGQENVAWKNSLLEVLGTILPDAFERLSQRLLREAGFTKVEVRGKSGDGGIDGVGVLRVNLVSFQIYFQCKRWKGSVGAKEIRDFRGALQGRADKGLFITTGTFTSQASEEATREGAIAIDLIDGDRFCDLLKENGLGVSTVESVRIRQDWFESI